MPYPGRDDSNHWQALGSVTQSLGTKLLQKPRETSSIVAKDKGSFCSWAEAPSYSHPGRPHPRASGRGQRAGSRRWRRQVTASARNRGDSLGDRQGRAAPWWFHSTVEVREASGYGVAQHGDRLPLPCILGSKDVEAMPPRGPPVPSFSLILPLPPFSSPLPFLSISTLPAFLRPSLPAVLRAPLPPPPGSASVRQLGS